MKRDEHPPLPAPVQEAVETADAAIENAIERYHLPGVAVGIVYQGALIYGRGFGRANVAEGTPVTPQTVFRIASVSKTFAGIGLMQLWEQGRFALDDPINDYLTGYKLACRQADAPPITFHHLLTHTAGLGELAPLYRYLHPRAHFNVVRPGKPAPPLRDLYGRSLPAEIPPGQKWCYANNGFATVGQLVADISGQPFPDYMRQHVFAPLGMETADFRRSGRVEEQLAIGYRYLERWDRFKPVIDLEQVTTAAGSMYASLDDMGLYLAALVGGGRNRHGAILQPETLELMYTPHVQLDERLQGMGYAFKVDDWDGRRVVSHDGLWLGFVSSLFAAPDDELAVFAVTNAAESVAISIARQLLQRALAYNPRPLRRSDQPPPPDTPELWPDLVGHYGPAPGFNTNFRFWQGYGGELEVYEDEEEGGGLSVRSLWGSWREGRSLRRGDPDDPYIFYVGTRPLIFRPGEEGAAGRLLMGLRELYQRPYEQSVRHRLLLLGVTAVILFLAIPAFFLWLLWR